METVLPCLTESQRKHIREAVAGIAETAQAEKIICYGIRTISDEHWSSFSNGSKSEPSISIDLLIILQDKDKRKRESVSDIVENLSNDNIRLIPVVHSMDAVNINLEQGSPFFTTVYTNGVLVYDSNRAPLSSPSGNISSNSSDESNQRKLELARMFYETACDCATDGRNNVAVFMFHQAVELACISVLRTCLGYKPTTHSIKKLFMLMENVTQEIEQIFPRSTNEEVELFNTLQRAYSDVRYKEEYTVPADKILVLLERVSEFQDLASRLCQSGWNQTIKHKGNVVAVTQSTATEEAIFITTREIPSFESIGIDTFIDIILIKGGKESMRIESEHDMTRFIETKIEDNRLWISISNDSPTIIPPAVIHLTYSTLTGIVVHNSGNVTCKEPIECNFLGIVQNGKGDINLEVKISTLDVTVTKTGSLKISGSADKVNVLNTGPGTFDGIDLETSEAKITIKDRGGVSIHVEDELNAALEGDGNLLLKGEPRLKRFTMA